MSLNGEKINGKKFLFYLAEDEFVTSDYCQSEDEAFYSFKTQYKRKPDRIIGILDTNKKRMKGSIVWENLDFM